MKDANEQKEITEQYLNGKLMPEEARKQLRVILKYRYRDDTSDETERRLNSIIPETTTDAPLTGPQWAAPSQRQFRQERAWEWISPYEIIQGYAGDQELDPEFVPYYLGRVLSRYAMATGNYPPRLSEDEKRIAIGKWVIQMINEYNAIIRERRRSRRSRWKTPPTRGMV
jgi:hypothetical protein